MEIQIDKGIRVPDREAMFRVLCQKMGVGDSFLYDRANSYWLINRAFRKEGFSVVTRKEGNRWRVWKVVLLPIGKKRKWKWSCARRAKVRPTKEAV